MEQHTGEINVCSMVQAFKGIGVRNQFKLLSFPFPWTAADLRDFMQLECLRSLESLELWDSGQAFLEAIELPVFLDTIRVLRLDVYISRRSTYLTTTHASILSDLLKKMPRLEHLSFQRSLLPDLSVFDGLARNNLLCGTSAFQLLPVPDL
ncbi:hypothetical protein BGX30_011456 [Mortierella sp. GBA39]|nr:hypothetical protein BGX30_011456 [Mortierella sp. GBA39]